MRYIILMFIVLSLLISLTPTSASTPQKLFTDKACEEPVFSLNMLSPASCGGGYSWPSFVKEELNKECINITKHLSLDWLSYTSRSIYYPVEELPDKRIPLFEDGGYDVGFVGLGWFTVPDLSSFYHSNSTVDIGLNWYNYISPTMDALLESYQVDMNYETRDVTAKKIQRILYEDQASMVLVEDVDIYAYNEDLLGFGEEEALVFSVQRAQDTYKLLGYVDTSKSVVYAHSYTVSEFSPWSAGNSAIGALYQNAIFQGLYQQSGLDLHLEPLIASTLPHLGNDNLTFTVTLNANATFANGNSVRAEDVYDSFLRVFDERFGASKRSGYIEHFGDPINTSASNYVPVDDMVRINVPGVGGELSFTFYKPYFRPELYLMFPIVDSTIWGSWDSPLIPYDTNGYIADNYDGPIGKSATGPFIYDTIDGTSGNVRLMRNENYWNGPVQAAYLDFQFYGEKTKVLEDMEDGIVDIADTNFRFSLEELVDIQGVKHHPLPGFGWQEMFLNMLHPVFGTGVGTPLGQEDPSRAAEAARYVRQAMSHLIPREVIIQEIVEGLGLPGVTQWIRGWQHRDNSLIHYEYSIAKAKELLAKAGYETWVYAETGVTQQRSLTKNLYYLAAIALVLLKRKQVV